jgi:hypothetical protein
MNFRACRYPTNDGDAEAEPSPVGLEKVKLVKSLLTHAALVRHLHRTGSARNPEAPPKIQTTKHISSSD